MVGWGEGIGWFTLDAEWHRVGAENHMWPVHEGPGSDVGGGEPWELEVLSQERLEMPGMEGTGVRGPPRLPPLAGVA